MVKRFASEGDHLFTKRFLQKPDGSLFFTLNGLRLEISVSPYPNRRRILAVVRQIQDYFVEDLARAFGASTGNAGPTLRKELEKRGTRRYRL